MFLEFARAANLSLDITTLVVRKPPEPDVRCNLNGEIVYFELGRLLSEGMQKRRLRALKQAPDPVAVDSMVQLPEREMLKKKLDNRYQTDGAPIRASLYYDNEDALVGDVPVFGDDNFGEHAVSVMAPLFDSSPGVFRRVWVYERHRCRVLWCHPAV